MSRVYVPYVSSGGKASFLDEREKVADLILKASWQQRQEEHIHSLLMQAAQYKADDMAQKAYFGHTSPTGEAPNDYVRKYGYPLPSFYPSGKNNVESLRIGYSTPKDVIEAWLNSPSHRAHVTGENSFYREQREVGVGLATHPNGGRLWVFISAPKEP